MIKKIIISLTILFAMISLFACSNEERFPLEPVEKGLLITEGCDPQPFKAVYCGYRFEKNQYNVNENIPFTLYYGVDVDERRSENDLSGPITITIKNNDISIIVKEHQLNDLFYENYNVTETYGELYSDLYRYLHINFNHNEMSEIPSYMFIGKKGTISIKIEHNTGIPSSERWYGYGWDTQTLYYQVENEKIHLSSEYTFISE